MATDMDKKGLWLCRIKTGDKLGAGTDANVTMVVYGDQGRSDEVSLTSNTDLMERGEVNELQLTLDKVGKIYKIRIEHDNKGLGSAWHLDTITLEHIATKVRYDFVYNDWLSRKHQLVAEIPATGPAVTEPLALIDYKVMVHTGKKRGSGTDANVFINVYGERGDSGRRQLRKSETHHNMFENGNVDVFVVKAVDLGALTKVRIGHDNSGAGPGWFLDKVVVVNGQTQGESQFPCNRWFDTREDDGQIERELPVLGANNMVADTVRYRISVVTSDIKGAGTDSNVFIILYGDKDDTGKLFLNKSETYRDPFERDHADVFTLEALDIGEIRKVRIGHDGRGLGASWHLDRVEIDVASQGKRYVFKCGRWLSTSEDDRQTERELLADDDTVQAYKAMAAYECTVVTGDIKGAGTDSNVFLVVYGKDGKSQELSLRNKTDNFERGMQDVFKLEFEDVGVPYKVRVWHDNRGLASAWHLDRIELRNIKSNVIYTFPADRWLSKAKGQSLVAELPVGPVEQLKGGTRKLIRTGDEDSAMVNYRVLVTTGDKRGGGTDANVFIIVYGERGDTGERKLQKSLTHTNKFERGHTDEFELEAVNLGKLSKVKIWHDNQGLRSGWYLDNVQVVDGATGEEFMFPCRRWLATNEEDGLTMRELGLKDTSVPEELATSVVNTSYTLKVFTSDIAKSGTDSNVFVTLYGTKGDSGVVPLKQSQTHRDKFERGHEDIFSFEAIDLGEIEKIKIWHDGHGVGSSWHLDKLVLDIPIQGKTITFPCGRWLAKGKDDGQLERILTPSTDDVEIYRAKVPYEAIIYTTDTKKAGTDANVFMEVYGRDKNGADLSDRIEFTNAVKSSFEAGSEDHFDIELEDIGTPYKIRIGHDNKGWGAAWHLDKVILKNKTTKEAFEFPCGRWLAKSEDDGKIVRELPLSSHLVLDKTSNKAKRKKSIELKVLTYKVSVVTGDVRGAGTDANVFCILYGQNGDSGEHKLAKSETYSNKFERGHTDVFLIDAVDLGELERVKIWHDNKNIGANWFLDRVEVECEEYPDTVWKFHCEKWLAKDKDDKQISRDLPVFVDPAIAAARAKKLRKQAEEAEDKAAALRGKPGSRAKAQLEEAEAEAEAARLAAENAERAANIAVSGPGSSLCTYEVEVTTGNKAYAGTDANVWVEFIGQVKVPKKTAKDGYVLQSTSTGKLELPSTEGEMERGRTNKYKLQAPGVGQLTKMRIGHDGARKGAGWYLENVVVAIPQEGARYFFPCSGWIAEDMGDKKLEKTLRPDTNSKDGFAPKTPYEIDVHTGDSLGAGTDAKVTLKLFGDRSVSDELPLRNASDTFERKAVDTFKFDLDPLGILFRARLAHDNGGTNPDWLVDKLVVRNLHTGVETVFPCGEWISKSRGRKSFRDLAAADNGSGAHIALKPVTYIVRVKTADERGAGTNANAFMTIFGALGDSGELALRDSTTHINKLEKGNTDVYSFDLLDLGAVHKVRVWHDDSGTASGWLLDSIEVENKTTSSTYTFPCGKWLDKSQGDHQIQRELKCAEADIKGRSVQYKIAVTTKDGKSSDTDADVHVEVEGSERSCDDILLENEDGTKLQRGKVRERGRRWEGEGGRGRGIIR